MIDIKYIESLGGSRKALRAKFDTDKPAPKIKQLIELGENRLRDGVNRCLRDARIYDAIDAAFNVCQRQITFSFVADLLAKGSKPEDILNATKTWPYTRDLDSMLQPCTDSSGNVVRNGDGSVKKSLDLPTFFHIFLPMALGYLTLRASKLYNDLNQYPLLPYDPLRVTTENRVRCKLITARGQRMTSQMGYAADLRQGINRALKYGRCWWFAKEPWYKEVQYPAGKKEVELEGVRWEQPPPGRCFSDEAHRANSFNTNTGGEFAGYWTVDRWGTVADDKTLWNTKRISKAYPDDFRNLWSVYRIGRECVIDFPHPGVAGGKNDRLTSAFYNSTAERDQGVVKAALFQRLIPKEWGLYDYKGPIWHRMTYGGFGSVLSVDPWAYTPMIAMEGDGDPDASVPTGLGLQLVPFQDQMTNFFVQYLLSVRTNLSRVVFVNADYVDKPMLAQLQTATAGMYIGTQFVPYSERETGAMSLDPKSLTHSVQREPQNVSEISTLIQNLLSMMERILGFSAQEMGQAAQHEQTGEEVRVIASNSGERLRTTASCIADGVWALKDRIYRAFMAYGSDEVFAEVAQLTLDDVKQLEKLGYTVEPGATADSYGVSGSKSTLEIDGFSSRRDGENLIRDKEIASAMIEVFRSVASNQVLVDRVGPDVVVDLFNQVLSYAGVPDDYRLKITAPKGGAAAGAAAMEEQQNQAIGQIAKATQSLGQQIGQIGQAMQQADSKIVELVASFKSEVTQFVQLTQQKNAQQDEILMATIQRLKALSDNVAQILQPAPTPGPAVPQSLVG